MRKFIKLFLAAFLFLTTIPVAAMIIVYPMIPLDGMSIVDIIQNGYWVRWLVSMLFLTISVFVYLFILIKITEKL